jgi:filamentous hemagglutinin family protein
MSSTALNCSRNVLPISLNQSLLLGVALIALVASSAACANPAGGAVSTGSALISTSSNKTDVDQKSEAVVIDWSSFNIDKGQTTQFEQPNAQALAVNRIGGANASQILGTLDANGRVVLINGNGLLIGKDAQVNVGSLIATSTDGSDSDLLAGKFTQAGKQNAAVVNNGAITAASGGVVALVAPNVTNRGTVNAKLGTVALGAANKFTVDFTGDGLVSFAAQGDVNAKASAVNSGLLSGANVSMTAHAANGIATGVVTMSGMIMAQGARDVGGTIYLDAGNGTLTTTGTLNAAGVTGGGQIETSGRVANISGTVTAGYHGQWKVDPDDLEIDTNAATTIDGALNGGTSVLEQTTSGAANGYGEQFSGEGDIDVDSALSWNSTATLTLDSYHSININAPITIAGAGGLTLITNDNGGSGGNYFFNGGNVTYTDVVSGNTQGSLTINSTSYELVNSVVQLGSAAAANSNANIAFANSYNAGPDGTYANSPVSVEFGGSFEGLGNTISNLKIDAPSTSNVGLFSFVNGTGSFSNISLVNVNVTGEYSTGAFIGYVDYTSSVRGVSSTGSVTSTADDGGGLLGTDEDGIISNSHSSATVNSVDWAGGLVGNLGAGTIQDSYATGSVSASDQGAGGLAGQTSGNAAQIIASYSSGSVSAANDAGGLLGDGAGGSILDSYSLANVSASGASAGGLVGNVYTATNTITDSYAAGDVTAGSDTGGLVGIYGGGDLTVTNSYWDKLTTGQTTSPESVNSDGLTTTALQASLQPGLNDGAFGIVAGVTYPYLTWQFPSGTPQVLAGTVYASNGTTPVTGQSVSALVDGEQITPLVSMSSGIDGYYYLLLAPGTIATGIKTVRALPPGSPVFAYLTSDVPGNSYVGNVAGGDSALNIDQDRLTIKSEARNTADLLIDLDNAVGSATGSEFLYTVSGGFVPDCYVYVADQSAVFTINTALDLGTGTLWLYDPSGAVTESGDGSITARRLNSTTANGLTLGSNDNAIAILGRISNTGSGGISFYDDRGIEIAGSVDSGRRNLSLTTANGGNIVIDQSLTTGGTLTLSSAGMIWENPNGGMITADTLTGSATDGVQLGNLNSISNLGDFTDSGGNFVLSAYDLTVTGTVNAGTNNMTLGIKDDLVVSGALDANAVSLSSGFGEVSGAGATTTNYLDVSADTGIDLTGDNSIGKIGTDTTTSGPNVIDNN